MTRPGDHDREPDAIGDAAQDWFLRQSEGALTPEEQAHFQAWLDADPRHGTAYREVRSLWSDIDGLEQAFASRQERAARPRFSWWRAGPIIAGLAAACLLLFVLGPSTLDLPMRLFADHSTAVGEQRMVTLPDGSVAILNTNTALDVDYSSGRRRIRLLHGEALFEVRKDPGRPFDVLAVDGRTTAVGTAFAVKDAAGSAVVTVTEGMVRVASPGAEVDPDGSGILVEAGGQVSYRRGAAPSAVASQDAAAATAWRLGAIVIRNRPLGEALAEIGRYHRGRIVLVGNSSRYASVTARLSLADLDGGIDALAATHGLSVTRVTDYLTIIR